MAKKRVTAGEVYAAHQRDPNRIARREQLIRDRKKLLEQAIREQSELIRELGDVGVEIRTISDLINSPNNYDRAIPTLVRHLDPDRNYSDSTIEGIVRALTCVGARGLASKPLLKIFESTRNNYVRWAVGNALSVVADFGDEEKLKSFLKDKKYGAARNMLPHALARLEGASIAPDLIELVDDPELTAEILAALGATRAECAEETLERFESYEDSWIRKKATAAKKKLRKGGK